MTKITIQENKLNPEHADFSQALNDLAVMADLRNAKKTTVGDTIVYEIPDEKLTLTIATQLHNLGVEVENYPLFIDTSVVCPFSYVDEEVDDSVAHTWETWKRADHTFIETTDNKTYLHSSAGTGKYLTVEEIHNAGLENAVIDLETLKAKMPINNEEL